MGLLNFILGKSKKIENDFFGTMLFIKDKKASHKSYFECRRHFKPINSLIEISIDGAKAGPTQIQIDFFKSIENQYTEITNSIKPLIENEVKKWQEGFKIENFNKEFSLIHLSIPRCETKHIIWEIAFESAHDRNHTFTLSMSDFQAKEILIDG